MNVSNYWMVLFTGVTWREFLDHGAKVLGFREWRSKTVKKIIPGDYLLCYVAGISRFIGVLQVTKGMFYDNTQIWLDEIFPCRVGVKVLITLTPETAVPVLELRETLSLFRNLKSPRAWSGYFRSSPSKWNASDGKAVHRAIIEAKEHPVVRHFWPHKLERHP